MKQQLTQMGPGTYMKQSLGMGVLFGAAIGALISFPLAPILQTLIIVVGLMEIARLAASIIEDFFDNMRIDNWCNVAQLVIEIAGEAVVVNHIGSNNTPNNHNQPNPRRNYEDYSSNTSGDYGPTSDDYRQAQEMVDRHRQEARDTYGERTTMQIPRRLQERYTDEQIRDIVAERFDENYDNYHAYDWQLVSAIEGPIESLSNSPDPRLGVDVERYHASFRGTDHEGSGPRTIRVSINYDPVTDTFGVIKYSSRDPLG